MPSKNRKQHNLMEMVAHDPKAAKRVGIPVEVGKDFVAADKRVGIKSKGKIKQYDEKGKKIK